MTTVEREKDLTLLGPEFGQPLLHEVNVGHLVGARRVDDLRDNGSRTVTHGAPCGRRMNQKKPGAGK